MDLSNKTDRELLEAIYLGLFDKQSPFDRDDDAPPQFVPVEGIEKVLGPKPHPSDSTAGNVWRREAQKVTKVYTDIPSEYEAGAMELAARTGVKAVFCDYSGSRKACLRAGLPPTLWLVDDDNFIGSGVEGLIRSVEDSK